MKCLDLHFYFKTKLWHSRNLGPSFPRCRPLKKQGGGGGGGSQPHHGSKGRQPPHQQGGGGGWKARHAAMFEEDEVLDPSAAWGGLEGVRRARGGDVVVNEAGKRWGGWDEMLYHGTA